MVQQDDQDLASDFCLAVLGDLHLDHRDMKGHEEGRQHIINNMKEVASTLSPKAQSHLISLGDLGAYGDAGTTTCFKLAKGYLDGYGLPYNLVTG